MACNSHETTSVIAVSTLVTASEMLDGQIPSRHTICNCMGRVLLLDHNLIVDGQARPRTQEAGRQRAGPSEWPQPAPCRASQSQIIRLRLAVEARALSRAS